MMTALISFSLAETVFLRVRYCPDEIIEARISIFEQITFIIVPFLLLRAYILPLFYYVCSLFSLKSVSISLIIC